MSISLGQDRCALSHMGEAQSRGLGSGIRTILSCQSRKTSSQSLVPPPPPPTSVTCSTAGQKAPPGICSLDCFSHVILNPQSLCLLDMMPFNLEIQVP